MLTQNTGRRVGRKNVSSSFYSLVDFVHNTGSLTSDKRRMKGDRKDCQTQAIEFSGAALMEVGISSKPQLGILLESTAINDHPDIGNDADIDSITNNDDSANIDYVSDIDYISNIDYISDLNYIPGMDDSAYIVYSPDLEENADFDYSGDSAKDIKPSYSYTQLIGQ